MVIKEYKNKDGAIIRFHDDCIRSKEEQEIIFNNLDEMASRFLFAKMVVEENESKKSNNK